MGNDSGDSSSGNDPTGHGALADSMKGTGNTNLSGSPDNRGGGGYANNGGQGGEGNSSNRGNNGVGGRGSLGSLRRADNRAVKALRDGPNFRDVNSASLAFHDPNPGPLDRAIAWGKDQFGLNAPGGFTKSDAANTALSIGLGAINPALGAIAGATHNKYAQAPGEKNNIGLLSGLGSAIPGVPGLVSRGVNLVDRFVDLDDQDAANNPSSAVATRGDLMGPSDPNASYTGGDNGSDGRGLLSNVPAASPGTETASGGSSTPSNSSNVGLVSNAAGEGLPTPGERFRSDRYIGGRWARNPSSGQLEWVSGA